MKQIMNDNRKTIKCRLDKIFKNGYDKAPLMDAINRTNNIIFTASHFIRMFILYRYRKQKDIPELNKQFIMLVFKTLSKKSVGPKSKRNSDLKTSLESFYKNTFIKLIHTSSKTNINKNVKKITDDIIESYKFDAKNLSYILQCEAEKMRISYTNNIQLNYVKYIRQFINQYFKLEHSDIIDSSDNKKEKRKQLRKELNNVKDDVMNGTLTSPSGYHEWINKYRSKIIPTVFNKTFEYDIKHYPFKYMLHMLFMNKYLNDNKLKMFQCISLRTEVKNKYITINSNALIDILPITNKNNYYKNVINVQKDIWEMFININSSKYRINGYSFNYQLETDGMAVSLNYIRKDEIESKLKKAANFRKARNKAKTEYKNKSDKFVENKKAKKEKKRINDKIKISEAYKLKQKDKKEEYIKLSAKEKEDIKLKMKLKNTEFNYIEDLVQMDTFMEKLKDTYTNNKIGYIDPGKRSPLYIMNNFGKTFQYSTARRLKETKRLKYGKLIDDKKSNVYLFGKINTTVKKCEANLSESMGSKSMKLSKFAKYTSLKMSMRHEVMQDKLENDNKSYNDYLQKLKWFSYINTRRHEDKLMNELEDFVGKDASLVFGDWGNKGKLSYISTPNISLKRKLKERFNVYNINEYNTSKIHHKTKEVCGNLRIPMLATDKDGCYDVINKKLHAVLTYKMSLGRLGCINRDKNAVRNFKIIVEELMNTKKRPEIYTPKFRNPS